jgi:hypothetical protein
MSVISNLVVNLKGESSDLDAKLDKASKGVSDLSGTASAIGGGIGALFGGIGAPIGAAIGGAVGKVASGLSSMFGSAKEGFSDLVKSGNESVGVAKSYTSLIDEIATMGKDAWTRLSTAATSAFEGIGSAMSVPAEQIVRVFKPVFNWLATAGEGVFFLIKEALDAVGAAIKKLHGYFVAVADKWVDFSNKFPDGGEVVIKTTKAIAQGLAYVYDALKALGGAAAFAAGKITSYLGPPVLGVLHDIASAMALVFPNDFGGKWFEAVSNKLDRLKQKAEATGKHLEDFGKGAFKDFGKTAGIVGAVFDKLLDKWKKRVKPDEKKEGSDEAAAKRNRAVERGSVEAFSIIAGQKGDKMFNVANKTLEEIRNAVKELKEIKKKKAKGVGVAAV